jgi:formylglycine-generating enzyme required for sulfatase activity
MRFRAVKVNDQENFNGFQVQDYSMDKVAVMVVYCLITIVVLEYALTSKADNGVVYTHIAGDIVEDEFGIEMVYVPGAVYSVGVERERLRELCEQFGEEDPDYCVQAIEEDSGATFTQMLEIQPFYIDRFEMTIEQYNQFCGVNALSVIEDCASPPLDTSFYQDTQQPQGNVSWYAADAICGLRLARLPTEAEWEYAASGPQRFVFPWGNIFDQANLVHSNPEYSTTYPVGSIFGNQSWVGLFDLTGNVAEWVEDRYATRILAAIEPDEWSFSEISNADETGRVVKGGNFGSHYWFLTNFYRRRVSPETASPGIGFRCARSLLTID